LRLKLTQPVSDHFLARSADHAREVIEAHWFILQMPKNRTRPLAA
jgi:hypothetical protein